MFGISLPSNIQTSWPSGFLTLFGAWSRHFSGTWLSNMFGGSTTWSSTLTRIMSSTFMPLPFGPDAGLLALTLRPLGPLRNPLYVFGESDFHRQETCRDGTVRYGGDRPAALDNAGRAKAARSGASG